METAKTLSHSPKRDKLVIMASVLSGLFLSALDQTIVSTALPKMVASLGGVELLSWVVSAYLLTSTATVIVYGKLSDVYGRKKLFLAGIGIFLAGSILCGLSQDIVQLIVFRGIQGIGGGAILVNSMAIIADLFPPAERGKWQGAIGSAFGLASIVGPLLGGYLTDTVGWHWIFFINVPIGIVSMAALVRFLPAIPGTGSAKIDYRGSAYIVAAISALMLALLLGGAYYAFGSAQILGLFALSALGFYLFVREERKAVDPILHLGIFKNDIFSLSSAIVFINATAMFGAIIYLPLFLQAVLAKTATESGLLMTPMVVSLVLTSAVAGQITSRTGKYKAVALVGSALTAAGMFILSFLGPASKESDITASIIVLGMGLGASMPVFVLAVQNAFEHSKIGVVTAALQFFRSIGGLIGVAVFGAIFVMGVNANLAALGSGMSLQNPDALMQSHAVSGMPPGEAAKIKAALSSALDFTFLVSAAVAFAGLVLTFLLREIPLRKTHDPTLQEAAKELALEEGYFEPKDEPKA